MECGSGTVDVFAESESELITLRTSQHTENLIAFPVGEKLLIEKRGVMKDGQLKGFFRLHPPRKGYGRKGIKTPFRLGGGLGNRESAINDLIERML